MINKTIALTETDNTAIKEASTQLGLNTNEFLSALAVYAFGDLSPESYETVRDIMETNRATVAEEKANSFFSPKAKPTAKPASDSTKPEKK